MSFPKVIPLTTIKEKLHCRIVKAVLRYHQPSPSKYIEQYAQPLFSFHPFRDEEQLKSPPFTGICNEVTGTWSNGHYQQKQVCYGTLK